MNKSRYSLIGLIIIILFSLFSCSSYDINYSEATLSKNKENFISQKEEVDLNYNYQAFDLLGKSAAIFLVNNSAKTPPVIINNLDQLFTKKLLESNLFVAVKPSEQVNKQLIKQAQIKQLSEIYLDTLTNISVSDKDISRPMAEYLNVDNLVVLQIDNWPCSECLLDDRIRIKIKIVNAHSSAILWTGIDEIYTLNYQSDHFPEMANILLTDLFQNFYNRFKIKWHKKRYHQLVQLN